MNKQSFFFDTYAFFEIIRGNEKYSPYIDSNIITTIFNLAEFNYNLKKEYSKEISDSITKKYSPFAVKVLFEDIVNAMDLKIKSTRALDAQGVKFLDITKKDLSIPDAIGYTIAKRLNVKFLTGDEDFKDFDNVEFVKK